MLARIAGHSSITVTQRYIHPQAEAINRVFSQVGTKLGTAEKAPKLKQARNKSLKSSKRLKAKKKLVPGVGVESKRQILSPASMRRYQHPRRTIGTISTELPTLPTRKQSPLRVPTRND